MTATMPVPTGDKRNALEDYNVPALVGLGTVQALPSSPEPWRLANAQPAESLLSGSSQGLRFLMQGAAVVLISTVTPSLGGGSNLADFARAPSGATPAPAPVYIAPVGRRRDDEPATQAAAPVAVAPAPAVTAGDQVEAVQSALGLSITEVARVVGVSRVAVHAWTRGDVAVPQSSEVQRRLLGLLQIAQAWQALSSAQLGGLARAAVTPEGRSLIDLLSDKEWDRPAIETALQQLSAVFAETEDARARQRRVGTGTAEATAEDIAAAERARNRRALQRAKALRHRR